MSEKERQHGQRTDGGTGSGPDAGGNLDSLRAQAETLRQAGRDAIRHALSGDSEAWLRANRQRGGQ